MARKKRDGGFTLIELMIVIAVIGILAVVLVPKVGTIKTQAKSTGIDANMRSVDAYVQSKINSWINDAKTAGQVASDIQTAFSNTEKLTNPYTSTQDNPVIGPYYNSASNVSLYIVNDGTGNDAVAGPAYTKGTVVVSIAGGNGTPITQINIFGHDDNGNLVKTINVQP